MTILKATNLAHNFDYPLFSDVDISLNYSESLSIIGVSGSGKSTLLHILSSLLAPKSGDVELFNKKIYELSSKELISLRRHDIGLIYQAHYLLKGFTAKENLEVASILASQKIDETLLKSLGVDHVINQKVTELSGGQQQRISIARVLTKKPRLIFADEPTGNLDTKTASDVMQIFYDYVKENDSAMVLVTHDEELAYECDHVYRLENQRLIKVK
ncbi:MAG: ABC transporter ATP-binding protein [Campylobacterota bacterium]|nr:ABC transporter ATP-binding protein [Campylobacterota bacterium]